MTRNWPLSIGLALSVLALVACGETTTEPETTQPLPVTTPAALAAASNTWITRAPMPYPAAVHGAATVTNAAGQSIVYAVLGYYYSIRANAYNVATNSWALKAELSTGRLNKTNGVGAIGNKIYISGGVGIRRQALGHLLVYDRATNSWTTKTRMPSEGFSGVTGVINGKLYVLTGCRAGADCDDYVPLAFYRYDPATDQWATLATPTAPHESGMGGVIGGKFYVAGGEDNGRRLEVYDPATNTWTTRAPMGRERWSAGGAALGGKLYVIGGYVRDPDGTVRAVSTTSIYDPMTDSWTTKAPMPDTRGFVAASRVALDGQPRIEAVNAYANLQYVP
jgi:N-acetylneuraminic acid mutarotase